MVIFSRECVLGRVSVSADSPASFVEMLKAHPCVHPFYIPRHSAAHDGGGSSHKSLIRRIKKKRITMCLNTSKNLLVQSQVNPPMADRDIQPRQSPPESAQLGRSNQQYMASGISNCPPVITNTNSHPLTANNSHPPILYTHGPPEAPRPSLPQSWPPTTKNQQ